MKKFCLLSIVILFHTVSLSNAQDSGSNGKAFNIPFQKAGISFGNSREFSGIRLNVSDSNVERINGLNLTLWYRQLPKMERKAKKNQIKMIVGMAEAPNKSAVVNGISVGLVPVAGTMQPLNLGVLGLFCDKNLNGLTAGGLFAIGHHLNGLSIGGLILIAPLGAINGLSAAGLTVYAKNLNGIHVSPAIVIADHKIRGVTIAGIWAGNGDKLPDAGIEGLTLAGIVVGGNRIKGVAVSPGIVKSKSNLTGIALSGISVNTGQLTGVAIAGITNINKKQRGLSVALVNRTKDLHGLQIGLINIAGNNRKGLRFLPVFNMHFGKTDNLNCD